MNFTNYLKNRDLSNATIKRYLSKNQFFIDWLGERNIETENISYTDLLDYVNRCKSNNLSKRYINQLLGIARHYFDWLKAEERIKVNPAANLNIRGINRRIPHDLLTTDQLEDIYQGYECNTLINKRNKAMLGLMVYQALRVHELELLRTENLKLREGKVYIPSTNRTNSRLLKLEPYQIIELQEYANEIRPSLLEITKKQSIGLFISLGSGTQLKNAITRLIKSLKKKHPYLKNPEQIRQSRICHWAKLFDIRQVQYLSGHKYVGSTERYQANDLEDLQKELAKYHPLK